MRRSRSPKGEGERLRDEILRATEKLLLKAGDADAVSIRAIAEAVGVTPPSIYLHFADKDALLFAVCEAQFRALEEAIAAATASVDDPVESFRIMGHTYVRFGTERPEEYRILLMSKGALSASSTDRSELPGMSVFRGLVVAVEECMRAGAIRDGDPHVVATAFWAIVHGITSLRIAVPTFPHIADDDVLNHLLATQMRGLAP